MKRNRVSALTGIFLLAGIFVLTPPASASKTPFDAYEVVCIVTPGDAWVEGDTLNIRGQHNRTTLYDAETFEPVGWNSIIANANFVIPPLPPASAGQLWGTFSSVYLPESETGTFGGTWYGEQGPGGLDYFGSAVGRGTEELIGKKIRVTLRGLAPEEMPPELLAIVLATDCELVGVYRDTGFIHGGGHDGDSDSD